MIVIPPASTPEKNDNAIENIGGDSKGINGIDGTGLTPEELNSNELVVEK